MKIDTCPFALVFLSCLLPMAGSFLNVAVYHIPAGLVLVAMVIAYSSTQNFFALYRIWLTWANFLLFILLMTHILTGRGFVLLASGGYVLIFAYVFHGLFLTGVGLSVKTMVRGISFIYKFFIVGMIIEFFVIICGKQPLLRELFHSMVTPNYKMGNGADVLRFFGFFHGVGGLNSVLLGSQIAGMLSLFAVIWFMGIKKGGISVSMTDRSNLWIFLSFAMLIVTINGTVFLLLFLAIIIHVIFINKKHRVLFLCVISSTLVGLYFLGSAGYLFPRMFSTSVINLGVQANIISDYGLVDVVQGMTTLEYYVFEFMVPVYIFISQDWVSILIGVGAKYFITTSDYLSGDFGFGAALLSSGLVWMAILVATIFGICFPAIRPAANGSNDQKLWSVLGSINGLIALLWLFSTVHYIQAFGNPGGIMLFAMHLALAVYCCKRLKTHLLVLPPLQLPR